MTNAYETLTEFARTAGTLYFFALFLGVIAYVLWPSNRDKFNRAARLPLAED
jgi:cytochrome c oxidase cbb3-type subunit 4